MKACMLPKILPKILFAAILSVSQAVIAGEFYSGRYGTPYGVLWPPFSTYEPARNYWLYVPTSYSSSNKKYPLLVMLHGCRQSAESFAAGTGMNALAEDKNFLVLYPNQEANPIQCWNWFDGATQDRGGEAAIITGMVNEVINDRRIDTSRIYVAGLSAGGAMASVLASCYPNVFAAAAIHSGVEYKAAYLANAESALKTANTIPPDTAGRYAYECSNRTRFLMPVMVFHGTRDSRVNPLHAMQVIRQFTQLNEYADDGRDNDSVRALTTSRVNMRPKNGRAYAVHSYHYGERLLLQLLLIKGMGHAWSGGTPVLDTDEYYDPSGPDASRLMWKFFEVQRRSSQ